MILRGRGEDGVSLAFDRTPRALPSWRRRGLPSRTELSKIWRRSRTSRGGRHPSHAPPGAPMIWHLCVWARLRQAGVRHGSAAGSRPITGRWRSRPRSSSGLASSGGAVVSRRASRSFRFMSDWLLARSPVSLYGDPRRGIERLPVGGQRCFERENATVCAVKRIAPICGLVMPAREARHAQSNRVGVFSSRGQTCVTMP